MVRKSTLFIMRGLPGSGKKYETTRILTRNFKEIKAFRINRSDLCKMFWPDNTWSSLYEDFIKSIEYTLTLNLLNRGLDVIIDSTNLDDISRYTSLKKQGRISVKIYDRRDVALDVILQRNEERIGKDSYYSPQVIISLARRYGLLK